MRAWRTRRGPDSHAESVRGAAFGGLSVERTRANHSAREDCRARSAARVTVRCRLGFHRNPFLHLDAAFWISRIRALCARPRLLPIVPKQQPG